jgi:TonB-linked SusC/RagA family outer membrane protein
MKRLHLFLTLLLCVAGNVMAQALTHVTGQVLAMEDGSPIIGATVRVLDTDMLTATDVDGTFTFSNLKPNARQIEVTFLGYDTKRVDITANMKIYLEQHSEMMDEVIVVAFGKQKRESFTGSATVVTGADIAQTQASNAIKALDGKIAGLNMTMSNSPDSNPSMLIRGISSLNAGSDPLIILDGMPYSGYWNDINPNDIENITVLKDAASNALYGSRGANGVILITTKNGQRGTTSINLDMKWGVAHDARVQYNTINDPAEYYEQHYTALKNYYMNHDGMTAAAAHTLANQNMGGSSTQGGLGYIVYSVPDGEYLIGTNGKLNPNATLGNRVAYNGSYYTLYPDNWRENGLRDGFRQEYNLSISGGNDNFKTLASLGYLNEEGIAYGNDLTRYTARLKTEYKAYSWLRIGANASYSNKVSNNNSSAFSAVYTVAPIYPLYVRDGDGNILTDAHGKVFDYGGGGNAGLYRAVEVNTNSIQYDRLAVSRNSSNAFNIQGYATADLTHGFELTINGNAYVTENRQNVASAPYYGYSANTGGATYVYHYRTSAYNYQQLLNYNNKFGQHNVSALLGHEYTRNIQTALSGSRTNIAMFDENVELNGAIVVNGNSSYTTMSNIEGYFLRAQYDFDNRYFASGSFRRDGSSRFHPSHRWGNFWSLGGAWILTRENWFPQSDLVNMLKYKISYGEQGNDDIGNFRYVDTYTIKNSNDEVAYVFSSKGNKSISWETVGCFNTGFEYELFHNRLRGSVEFYDRKTTDMLMYYLTPTSAGYSGYYTNAGDMNNLGIEAELTADIIVTPNVTWSVNGNISWQRNRVTRLPDEVKEYNVEGYDGFINGELYVGEGLPMNTWYMRKYAGVSENGEAMYYKNDADGNMVATTDFANADYYLCGSALPTVFGGFGTNLRVHDFDLVVNFAYSIGGKKFDSGYQALMTNPMIGLTGKAIHKDVLNAWSADNTESNIPRWQYQDGNAATFCDRWLTDASYLSLRTITLGYNLPSRLAKRLHLARLRFYATADNVFYWTKRTGFDPRTGSLYGDYGGYSPTRSISGGITVQF